MWFLKKLDWWILSPAFFLVLSGLVMLVSIGSRDPDPFFWFWRQLLWIGLGLLLLLIFSFFDYRVFKNSSAAVGIFFLVTILLLVMVLFWGKTIRGSRAWFELGSFTFQPVEFAKIALLLVLAKYFAQKNIEIWHFRHILFSVGLLALPLILVLLQPDWGSGLTLVALWFGMVLLAGARVRQVAVIVLLFAVLGGVAWYSLFSETQKERVLALLDPERDPLGTAYNQRQAIIAIGAGGVLGKGLGQGSQSQLKFLPASRTDFIFASIAEELGLLGVAVLLLAFGILFYEITKISLEATNNFSRLFSLGFLILLSSHIFINLGMNLGVLPVIGIGLPFVSYGGSSMASLFLGLGILSSIKIRT
jgi:rod shape determining protein RodA